VVARRLWSPAAGAWLPIRVNDNQLAVTLRSRLDGGRAVQGRATLSCRLRPGASYRLGGRVSAEGAAVWLLDGAGRPVCRQAVVLQAVVLQAVVNPTLPLF